MLLEESDVNEKRRFVIRMRLGLEFYLKRNNYDYIENLIENKVQTPDDIIKVIDRCSDSILLENFLFVRIKEKFPDWSSIDKFCSSYKFMKMAVKNSDQNLDYAKCKIDKTLVNMVLKGAYSLSNNTPISIRKNREYVKKFIKKCDGNQIDFALCPLDEELISFALKRGYWLKKGSPKEISGNIKYVKDLVYNHYIYNINYATCEIDSELINFVIQEDYRMNEDTPLVISSNKKYVKIFIEKHGGHQIDYAKCEVDAELIELAIQNHYWLSENSLQVISGNKGYVKKLIEKNSGNQIDYATCEIDDELIELAIANGYKLNEKSLIEISGNKEYVKALVEKHGGQQIDDAKCEIDEEMLDFLIRHGYDLSSFSLNTIKSKEEHVKKFIKAYGGNQLDYATCIVSNELFDYAIKCGLTCNISNVNNYDNVNLDKYFDVMLQEKTSDYREKIKLIREKTSSFVVYCLKDDLLLNEKIVDVLGVDLVVRCIKYLYLLGNYIDLDAFLKEENRDCFKFIFSNILEKSFEDVSINEFYEIVNNYSLYSNLIMNIMKSGMQMTEEEKNKLTILFKNKDNRIKVKELADLDNISTMVIEENKKAIESNDITLIKDSIYLTSFHISHIEIEKLRSDFKLNADKITDLMKSIKDEKIKSILSNYQVLFEIIEFIENCQNIEVLKAFLNQININLSKDGDYFKESHDLFYNIIDKMKYFYGVEIFEKMSNDDEKPQQEVKTLESTDGKKVQYFNIFSNKYYFQHTLNAYGSGGKLSDFKNPRLVGKTYICLSLIDNNHKGVKRRATNIDHVTLLFDKLSPSSLCVFSEEDIGSEANTNSREVKYYYSNFDTTENILKKTKRYNEYVYYRENNDGRYIYPSGVLVTGIEPSCAEIDAAAYLEVPLIKLNPTKKKVKQSSVNGDRLNKKQDLIKGLKEMKEYLTTLEVSSKENSDIGRSHK